MLRLDTESSDGRDEKLTRNGGTEQGRKKWIVPGSSLKRQGCTVNTGCCELTRLFPIMPRAVMNEHGEVIRKKNQQYALIVPCAYCWFFLLIRLICTV
jgi:hypothetical protein